MTSETYEWERLIRCTGCGTELADGPDGALTPKRVLELEAALLPFAEAYRKGGDFYSMADRIDSTHFLRAAEAMKK